MEGPHWIRADRVRTLLMFHFLYEILSGSSPFSIMLAIGLSYIVYIVLRYVLSITHYLSDFIMIMLNFVKCLLHLLNDHIISVLKKKNYQNFYAVRNYPCEFNIILGTQGYCISISLLSTTLELKITESNLSKLFLINYVNYLFFEWNDYETSSVALHQTQKRWRPEERLDKLLIRPEYSERTNSKS